MCINYVLILFLPWIEHIVVNVQNKRRAYKAAHPDYKKNKSLKSFCCYQWKSPVSDIVTTAMLTVNKNI